MNLIRAMEVFNALVESGSFVAAAAKLDTSTAAVSRQIAALEQHLETRLVNRTTRRLSLTEAGLKLHERSLEVLADISEIEALAQEHAVAPRGVLRVSAPLSFGIAKLGEILPEFRRRHPDLRLDIDLTDRMVDLAHEGVDVAIRIAQSPSGNLIVRKISPIRIIACASPEYITAHGMPEEPEDLARHQTLAYSYHAAGNTLHFEDRDGRPRSVRLEPVVHSNNGDLLRDLAVAGGGVIVQPEFIVWRDIDDGRLVPILPGWAVQSFNLYAVYLSRRFLSAKVRVFIDFLVESLGKNTP